MLNAGDYSADVSSLTDKHLAGMMNRDVALDVKKAFFGLLPLSVQTTFIDRYDACLFEQVASHKTALDRAVQRFYDSEVAPKPISNLLTNDLCRTLFRLTPCDLDLLAQRCGQEAIAERFSWAKRHRRTIFEQILPERYLALIYHTVFDDLLRHGVISCRSYLLFRESHYRLILKEAHVEHEDLLLACAFSLFSQDSNQRLVNAFSKTPAHAS